MPVAEPQCACYEKLNSSHVFNVRKTKRTAKFDGLEPRCCGDRERIVASEIDPKSFGTSEKQAPGGRPRRLERHI